METERNERYENCRVFGRTGCVVGTGLAEQRKKITWSIEDMKVKKVLVLLRAYP